MTNEPETRATPDYMGERCDMDRDFPDCYWYVGDTNCHSMGGAAMNEKERKEQRVRFMRTYVSNDYQVERDQMLVTMTLDPGTINAKLLSVINLQEWEVRKLRDLCNVLLDE
jgi:hypothetical protein